MDVGLYRLSLTVYCESKFDMKYEHILIYKYQYMAQAEYLVSSLAAK
jgi:hypothetical protein